MDKTTDKDIILHMIGNAHIDPVWMWRWQEGFQETKATFRSALDRMNESDDFLFTASSAQAYAWIEANDPAMFAEIQARVHEGRWQLVGGWWTEPDTNIPSGESFVRQALYGQLYFLEKFGQMARVGYNIDSFGHNGMLPQILKKSGLDYYVFMRPMPGEKALPARLFRWESDDGSQVLTFRILFEYLTWGKEVDTHVRRCLGEMKPPEKETMVFYGVGNHGGGPTQENLASIRRLNDDPDLPTLRFSHPLAFFERMEQSGADFPIVHDDLQHHASGCYSAHSAIKRWNRKAEQALLAAEKYCTAVLAGQSVAYPQDFDRAWKNVLFNQFHDIMAGTSLEAAYTDAGWQYGESLAIAQRNLNQALQSLSWRIQIETDSNMRPLVVFNTHAWPVKTSVEIELGSVSPETILRDQTGTLVPWQLVQPQATSNGRSRLCFMADLPAFGWRVYKLYLKTDQKQQQPPDVDSGDTWAENAWYRVTFSPLTGCISSLYDKQRQAEVFRAEAAAPVVIDDPSDTWSHDVLHFQKQIGPFRLQRIYRAESGPVKAVIRVISVFDKSRLVQNFSIYADKPQIDVHVSIDWHGKHQMVKLLFPVNAIFNRNSYEIPYGYIEREGNGEEEPLQNWLDISGLVPGPGRMYTAGVAILNDGKYSASVAKDVIGLTILRSPIYAHHLPHVPSADREYVHIDQGFQQFNYAILPHTGNWETAGVVRAACELNCPPETIIETYHDGDLPQERSMIRIDDDNLIMTAFKLAEDGQGYVMRVYESCKKQTETVIDVPLLNRRIPLAFCPSEIKTLYIPFAGREPVRETNLIEQ